MTVFCLQDFKTQVELLRKKNSYRGIEKDIIVNIFDKSCQELKTGTCLNNNLEISYLKKRIGGSGGYRLYCLLNSKEEKLYLIFIHPKTGTYGSSNLTEEGKVELYKEVAKAIEENNLLHVTYSGNKSSLVFTKVK